ncbi:MAG: hypothetical protein ABJK37_08690 [Paraglaciecola sp.]|uniref:hypothetical protein n=1 Tax=Paraglaciecola sp. TaxID=1920173 RepID=UPI003299FD56
MLEVAKWYFIIGLCCSIYIFIGFLLVRHRIENPISFDESITLAGLTVLFWPLSFVSMVLNRGFIEHLVTEVPFPFSDKSRQEAMDRNQKEMKDSWEKLPLCGQYVCARGLDEANYQYTAATFIFKSSELVELLGNDPLSLNRRDSEEAKITNWLRHRDEQLHYYTLALKVWQRMPYIIIKAIDQGVGECYCPECSTSYSATELLNPKDTGTSLTNYKIFHCPNHHLIHKTESIRFIL